MKRFLLLPLFLILQVSAPAADANKTLLDASSPFEDMAEFALAKDEAGLAKSLAQADAISGEVRAALPEAAHLQFDSLLKSIHSSATAGAHHAIALNAVEVFRLFIDHLDTASLKVPQEVSLLDYAGFRLHVLTAAPEMDWDAMRKTIADATNWWAALKPKVTSKALRDTLNSALRGLKRAGEEEHVPMMNFAAQMDLDLVDLLEHFFEEQE